jgi:hypothetical protein
MIKELKAIKKEHDLKRDKKYAKDDDGRIVVDLSIRNDDYFLSPYSTGENSVLSAEVSDFIEHSLMTIPVDESIKLRIHSDVINEEEKIEYSKAIKEHYSECYKSVSYEKKRHFKLAFIMAFVAILVLTVMIGLDLSGINNAVALEVLDIVAWVFMWEAVDIFFMKTTFIRLKEKRYLRLCDCSIEFVKFSKN